MKMILSDIIHLHPLVSLAVIITILTVAVLLSIRKANEMGGVEAVAHAFEEAAEVEKEPDFGELLHEKPHTPQR
jgi:hypothetical protein